MTQITPPGPVQQVTNRRQVQRKTAMLRGKISWDDGARSLDCTIRDISGTGARVDLAAGQVLPDRVFLIVMRDSMAYSAEVKWRKPRQIGLFFLRPISLHERVPENLAYLKQLWASAHVTARAAMPVEITPEMVCAGLAAYSGWKASCLSSLHSEQDLVRSVFAAMQRAMPNAR